MLSDRCPVLSCLSVCLSGKIPIRGKSPPQKKNAYIVYQCRKRPNIVQSLVDRRWATSLQWQSQDAKPWNLLGCSKLTNWSQPLVGRSSPYCEDVLEKYCSLAGFYDCWCMRQICAMVSRWRIFSDFLRSVFSVSRVQHVSDVRLKFALRPHHVWKYGRHPISDRWD